MFDLDDLVSDCVRALDETAPSLAVRDVVGRAVSDPRFTDAVGSLRGGMQVLHHAPDLTILNLVWPPLVRLYPHDHRMWAAIGIYGGQEDNAFFRRHDGTIVESGGKELRERDVLVLGAEVIHAVHNPGRQHTGAIHVYGGDFFNMPRSQWTGDPVTEEPFDVAEVNALLAAAEAAAHS